MQRTAVLYGVALSTLVAAFFLAPRLRPAAPPPPPPQVADRPVVDLAWSDGTLQMRGRLDRGVLLAGGIEPLWLDLTVTAAGAEQRAPLTAVLVVDRSGSMAGDKIESARLAAGRFVAGLRDGDQLAMVSFGTDVTVDLPLTSIDSTSRAQAQRIAARIEEGGGTNIAGALRAAKDLLARADRSGRAGRIVFVSDGRPTEGDRRTSSLVTIAEDIRGAGVTMSTLGLGLDYNEDLMEALAVQGGGRYHYLRDGRELARILDDELKHASSVVASGVKIFLPPAFAGLRVAAAPGAQLTIRDRAMIDVGDLAAGESRRVLVRLDVEPSVSGASIQFAAPEVTYRRPMSNDDALLANRGDHFRVLSTGDANVVEQSRMADVRVRVLQVEASLAMTESMSNYAEGDVAGATKKLAAKKDALRAAAVATGSADLMREAQEFDAAFNKVQAAAPSSTAGMDLVKESKAKAFDLRR